MLSLGPLEQAIRGDGGVPMLAPLAGADAASFALVLVLAPAVGIAVACRRSTVDALKGF